MQGARPPTRRAENLACPAQQGSGQGGAEGGDAARAPGYSSGPETQDRDPPRESGDLRTLEPGLFGARGALGCRGPSGLRQGRARPSQDGRWRHQPRPSSEGLPRHLPDEASSTSSSSGPGLAAGGGGGREASPRSLCSPGSSLPRPLPGGARQRPPPRPTAPRRSLLLPPARRLFPIPASPLGATEGSRGSGRGGRGAERRDTSPWEPPQPRSPSGKLCWPDGCPRGGKRSSNMATRIQILPLSPLP
ncbi:collagen alpha-1(III) chain-like [Cebus imitator]|uniref:collagen alpha-1(III) chain-like n=1 Tax=Cebus imitator TaxID=2715852 RepID=UPI001897AC61|nr:collagen alpha-1(III) chain-like [Cebus imitator]